MRTSIRELLGITAVSAVLLSQYLATVPNGYRGSDGDWHEAYRTWGILTEHVFLADIFVLAALALWVLSRPRT
jgi:hypothetical protein